MAKRNWKNEVAGISESAAAVGESVAVAGTIPLAHQGGRSCDGRIHYEMHGAEPVIGCWYEEVSAIVDFAEAVRLLAHTACDASGTEEGQEPLEPMFRIVRLLTERLRALEAAMEIAPRGDGLAGAKIAVQIGSALVPDEGDGVDGEERRAV